MPIITILILILVDSRQDKTRQDKTRQDKTRWSIHRLLAYNDNDNDYHYSMNSDGIKITQSIEYDSSLTDFWSNKYESWERTYIHIYVCVCPCVCVYEEDGNEERKRKEREKKRSEIKTYSYR